ncbi:transposable element Tcb1 transposase [Trichonephila clavipes]|nr:transposable element Tcb1 transposase [Trichonephila clavipes]
MSRRKQRSVFDQVSEFDRGKIVAYRDCGLPFREIDSCVGRNQRTVMRICDRWMQEDTTNRNDRSHLPQCTTSHEDRQIVRMTVTDHSVTSRTIAQHIESVTHIQCLRVPFDAVYSRVSATPRWSDLSLETPWREDAEQLRHTGPSSDIMVWGGIEYPSLTTLVRIAGTLNSQRYVSEVLESVVLPYLQGLATAIFQKDNVRSHMARIVQRVFVHHQIELLP